MVSNRRRKQKAQSLGLTEAELQLTELLGQMLELLRWNQVLPFAPSLACLGVIATHAQC